MTHPRKIQIGLAINAVLLAAILSRGHFGATPAKAEPMQIDPRPAGGQTGQAGLTVMPGQLSVNGWGCYLLDTQNQTLCVYQYVPGEHDLKFLTARDISADRLLKKFNTSPPPSEIRQMVDQANGVGKSSRSRD